MVSTGALCSSCLEVTTGFQGPVSEMIDHSQLQVSCAYESSALVTCRFIVPTEDAFEESGLFRRLIGLLLFVFGERHFTGRLKKVS